MQRLMNNVHDFHTKFGLKVRSSPPTRDDYEQEMESIAHDGQTTLRQFRINLIREECNELIEALESKSLPEVAHEAADLIYVVLGTMVSLGVRMTPIWALVHAANMGKARGHLKPIKPEGWEPADEAIGHEIHQQTHRITGLPEDWHAGPQVIDEQGE